MKVLVLHREDDFLPFAAGRWDLVIDAARAPAGTYEHWRRHCAGEFISLYDFAVEVQDLYAVRELFQAGFHGLVDRDGIDWWDLLSLEIVPEVQIAIRLHRLADKLKSTKCDLYCSRADAISGTLARILSRPVRNLESGIQQKFRRIRSYAQTFARLDAAQLAQIAEDKLDPHHDVRRHLSSVPRTDRNAAVLLPTAYINGTRTALAYAALLPEQRFKLVYSRTSANSKSLASNVTAAPLSPYFSKLASNEIQNLEHSWNALHSKLKTSEIWTTIDAIGALQKIPRLLPWALSLRNAWKQFFDRNNISACLCTDDSNPPTRLPLILARQRGLPGLSCHHGALDSFMAIKQHHEDFYLAKSEMERDYLQRVCEVPAAKIMLGAPTANFAAGRPSADVPKTWLVFFTEPYSNMGWRQDEVWQELLPALAAMAQKLNLELVLKLHPFENAKSYRRLLRRSALRARIITGPITEELWQRSQVALTVQSSTALECAGRQVPVYLCSWLRDASSGYVPQYTRYHVGSTLASVEQIENIPALMAENQCRPGIRTTALSQETFRELIRGQSIVTESPEPLIEGVVA